MAIKNSNGAQTQTRNVPALSMRAALKPESANAEKRTVDVIFSTGAAVLRRDWEVGQFYEELSLDPRHVILDRLNNGAPFLADHEGRSVIDTHGVVVAGSARIAGGKGVATIRFAEAGISPDTDKLFALIRTKVVQNVSIGYRVHKMEKVEGGDAKIPTYRATSWEPYEISAVAMGADDGAGFRSTDPKKFNPCTFVVRNRSTAMDEENEVTKDEKAISEIATRAERERQHGIRAAFRALGDDDHEARMVDLIDTGASLTKARAIVLDLLAERSDATSINSYSGFERGADDRDQFARGMAAWMHEKAGTGVVERAAAAGVKGFDKVGEGSRFRGMSMFDIARACLERSGVRTQGLDRMKLAGLAMTTRNGFGTPSDFPVLYENVMNKELEASYALTPSTWSKIAKSTEVPDFRDSHRFLVGGFGGLPVVPPSAEYKNVAIPDGEKISINTETRGGIIALSRHAIINDDLGAMADLAARFGRSAQLSIEIELYALLALNSGLGPTMGDGNPYFHSSHGNVQTSAALTGAALDLDRQKMREQTDVSGSEFLDLNPRTLLVPIALETLARSINTDAFDHDSTKVQKSNMQRGMFKDVVSSPRLTATSTTRRYLFADHGEAAAFMVAFLQGNTAPRLTSQEGFRRDGIEWKISFDFKVQAFDVRAGVTNAGT